MKFSNLTNENHLIEKSANQNISYIHHNQVTSFKKRNKKKYNLLLFPVNEVNKGIIQKL